MRILIVEDENPAANRLIKLLKPLFPDAEIFGNLDTIQAAVDWLNTHPQPDLLFCDIQLADGISFEIFEKIQISAPVIFTTAFDQYAIRAFQVNAIDYLLKPIDPVDLARAVEKYKSHQLNSRMDIAMLKDLLSPKPASYKSRFLVKYGEKIQSIPAAEISFFFSEERVTFIQTDEGKKYVLEQTLEQTESVLDPSAFFRLNRKYICSFDAVEEIFTYSNSRLKVMLKNCADSDILISREKVQEFKSWLDR